MMKNMFLALALALILAPAVSFGIWVPPASQVSVNTQAGHIVNIHPATNTVQATFEALDVAWPNLTNGVITTNHPLWFSVVTNFDVRVTTDPVTNWAWSISNHTIYVVAPDFLTEDRINLDNYVSKDDICSYIAFCNSGAATGMAVYTYVPGTYHDGFTDAGLTYQYFTFATNVGATYEVYCWGAGGASSDSDSTWGGGPGGYSYGQFVVTNADSAVLTNNMACVAPGTRLAVQVGSLGGRAAVWPLGKTNAGTVVSVTTAPLIAGGGGGGYRMVAHGGAGGGASAYAGKVWSCHEAQGATAGGGGTATAGGTNGTAASSGTGTGDCDDYIWSRGSAGNIGAAIWGGDSLTDSYNAGGDGYYGGGSGSRAFVTWSGDSGWTASGGGGGSGYVHADLAALGGVTVAGENAYLSHPSKLMPPYMSSVYYGANAGQPGYAGRVVVVRVK